MITIVIPYFNQPLMYEKQLETLEGCPFPVIFIDDFSDVPIRTTPKYTYYRIIEDKGINWQGAKNLGALMAETEWLLMTDIDHTTPKETIDWLKDNQDLDKNKVYKFKRRINGKEKDSHPNSFLITRYNFMSKGGYDLRFQGTKGGEVQFTTLLDFELLPVYLETYGADQIKDAMTPRDDDKEREKRYNIYKKMPVEPLINFKFEEL